MLSRSSQNEFSVRRTPQRSTPPWIDQERDTRDHKLPPSLEPLHSALSRSGRSPETPDVRRSERRAHDRVRRGLANALARDPDILAGRASLHRSRTDLLGGLDSLARRGHIIAGDHPTGSTANQAFKINTQILGQLADRRLGKYRATRRGRRRRRLTWPRQRGAGWRVLLGVQGLAVVGAA